MKQATMAWLVVLGLLCLGTGMAGCADGEDDEECEEGLLVCVRDIEPVTPVTVTPSCPGVHCPLTSPNPPLFSPTPPPPFPTNPLPPPPPPTIPRPPLLPPLSPTSPLR